VQVITSDKELLRESVARRRGNRHRSWRKRQSRLAPGKLPWRTRGPMAVPPRRSLTRTPSLDRWRKSTVRSLLS
jgi:hypothetical protein